MCERFEEVRFLAFDSKRYVGAQIGIFNPSGESVGQISHLRNKEWVVVAGPKDVVKNMTDHVLTDDHGNVVPPQPKLF